MFVSEKEIGLTSTVIIEERVQTGTVDIDVGRVDDSQSPSVFTVSSDGVAGCFEWGIVPARDDWEWNRGFWIWLVVCGLGLDLTHVHIRSVGKLILVESVMFN